MKFVAWVLALALAFTVGVARADEAPAWQRAPNAPQVAFRMKVAGLVLTIAGAATIFAGAAVMAVAVGCAFSDNGCGGASLIGGAGVFGAGGALIAVGIPLWAVGQHRQNVLASHRVSLSFSPTAIPASQPSGAAARLTFRF